jgi:hypothetical protein
VSRKRIDPSLFIAQKFERRPPSLDQIGRGIPLLQDRPDRPWKYYCPLCHVQRTLHQSAPKPTHRHYAQIALTTAVVMLALWPWTHWKGAVFFVPIWAVFELIFRVRTRAALICGSCGFDPTLYLIDPKKARADVEVFWRKKFAEKGIPYPGDEDPSASAPDAENQRSESTNPAME